MKQKKKIKEKISGKKLETKINRFIWDVFLMWCVFSLVVSCFLFYIGFHNLDQSRNILYLSYNEGQTYYDDYIDISISGNPYTFTSWYRGGISQIFLGFHIMLFNVIIFLIYSLKFKSKIFSRMSK